MIMLRDDPWFDEQAILNRIKNLWMQLQLARSDWDLSPLKPYFSKGLYQKEEGDLGRDQAEMKARYAGRPAVIDARMTAEPETDGRTVISCELFTRLTPRILRQDTKQVLSEGRETFFHEKWILSRPVSEKTPQPGAAFSVNCPNCGAPFSLYKSAKCPMCRSLIVVPDFTWTVDRIEVLKS